MEPKELSHNRDCWEALRDDTTDEAAHRAEPLNLTRLPDVLGQDDGRRHPRRGRGYMTAALWSAIGSRMSGHRIPQPKLRPKQVHCGSDGQEGKAARPSSPRNDMSPSCSDGNYSSSHNSQLIQRLPQVEPPRRSETSPIGEPVSFKAELPPGSGD